MKKEITAQILGNLIFQKYYWTCNQFDSLSVHRSETLKELGPGKMKKL